MELLVPVWIGLRRLVAKQVGRAPAGKVVFQRVSEEQQLGQVVELPPPPAVIAAATGPSAQVAPKPLHTGLIRYLPAAGQVLHIPFSSTDVQHIHGSADLQQPAGGPPLRQGCFVLFNVCTDTRAASASAATATSITTAATSSEPDLEATAGVQTPALPQPQQSQLHLQRPSPIGQEARRHAAISRAVHVMVLGDEAVAVQAVRYLGPRQQRDLEVLSLLGNAFPAGRDGGELAAMRRPAVAAP